MSLERALFGETDDGVLGFAKAEVSGWPVLGKAIEGLGANFVDRASIESRARALRRAFTALCSGASVINFPEGSTSSGAVVGPFQRGIFGIAMRAGVPILPVRIDYSDPRIAWTGSASFLPHYLGVLGMRSIEARLRIGDPIVAAPTRTPEELAEQAIHHPVHRIDVFERVRAVDRGNIAIPPFDAGAARAAIQRAGADILPWIDVETSKPR